MVLIPTKEMVYGRALERVGVPQAEALRTMLSVESSLWADIGCLLNERTVEWIESELTRLGRPRA